MFRSGTSGQLVFGLMFIGIGVLFLLRNYAGWQIDNWWALFILIPAVGALWAAWLAWRATGIGYAVAGPLTAGLVLLAVTAIFLLDLRWSQVWPVFLILVGVGALLPSLLGGRRREWPSREEDSVTRA